MGEHRTQQEQLRVVICIVKLRARERHTLGLFPLTSQNCPNWHTSSSQARPPNPFPQLEAKYSNMGAYGNQSHSNQCNTRCGIVRKMYIKWFFFFCSLCIIWNSSIEILVFQVLPNLTSWQVINYSLWLEMLQEKCFGSWPQNSSYF